MHPQRIRSPPRPPVPGPKFRRLDRLLHRHRSVRREARCGADGGQCGPCQAAGDQRQDRGSPQEHGFERADPTDAAVDDEQSRGSDEVHAGTPALGTEEGQARRRKHGNAQVRFDNEMKDLSKRYHRRARAGLCSGRRTMQALLKKKGIAENYPRSRILPRRNGPWRKKTRSIGSGTRPRGPLSAMVGCRRPGRKDLRFKKYRTGWCRGTSRSRRAWRPQARADLRDHEYACSLITAHLATHDGVIKYAEWPGQSRHRLCRAPGEPGSAPATARGIT